VLPARLAKPVTLQGDPSLAATAGALGAEQPSAPQPGASRAPPWACPSSTSGTVPLADLRMQRVRRGLLSAAAVIEEQLQSHGVRYRAAMVTTTYRNGVSWSPLHLTVSLRALKEWARRRGIWVKYVWRLEFTQRGVPHYHVLVWLPRGRTMPLWDKRGWWPHGMTNAQWAQRPVGYMAKYAAKGADWPPGTAATRGARWFGAGGLGAEGRLRALWRCAPRWLRDCWPQGEPLKRLASSWWRLGTFCELRSPWAAELVGDGVRFTWRGWPPDSVRAVA